jgi:hypothetical protein
MTDVGIALRSILPVNVPRENSRSHLHVLIGVNRGRPKTEPAYSPQPIVAVIKTPNWRWLAT